MYGVTTTKRIAITHATIVFSLIWLGQLVSLIGSGLTGFALGVWVYQRTGSVTAYTLISLFGIFPSIIMSPLAGVLTDRWNRRWVMLLSDSGSALSTLGVLLLLWAGKLEAWHIYVATAVSATFGAFQWPAYYAATTQLVPKQHFGRASGMVQFGQAAAQLISPVLAGVLLVSLGLQGIVLIDFVTFLFAVITLLVVWIPKPGTSPEGAAAKGPFGREVTQGWQYVIARPGLSALLVFFAIVNFSVGAVEVLITPLILSFASETTLGLVMSIAGCGMLVGSLVMSAWGGPQRRIYGVLGFTLLQGVLLFLGGLRPNVILVASAAFVFLFSEPMIIGCSQAIWQSKVPSDMQGRVYAVRAVIAGSAMPLAYIAIGPLADQVFEPLLAVGGPLATNLGQFIGVGPGRGIGLLFVLLGILSVLATLGGYSYPRLRRMEDELPDVSESPSVVIPVLAGTASVES